MLEAPLSVGAHRQVFFYQYIWEIYFSGENVSNTEQPSSAWKGGENHKAETEAERQAALQKNLNFFFIGGLCFSYLWLYGW